MLGFIQIQKHARNNSDIHPKWNEIGTQSAINDLYEIPTFALKKKEYLSEFSNGGIEL